MLPEGVMMYEAVGPTNIGGYAGAYKDKPMLIVSACPDTSDEASFDDAIYFSRVNVDGKFNPAACQDFVTYDGCCFWETDELVGSMFLSFNREQGYFADYPVLKIKNLYYYEPEAEDHPFFACQFEGANTWDENHDIAKSADVIYITKEYYQYGNVPLALNDDSGKYVSEVRMLYENGETNWTGSDGSGFLSSELYHGLLVKSTGCEMYNKKIKDQKDLLVGFQNIQLPEGNSGTMKISFVQKLDSKNNPFLTDTLEKDYMPVFVMFDGGEKIQILKDSKISPMYKMENATVSIPAGAKTVAIGFGINPTYTYVVDNLILSTGWTNSVADVDGETKTLSIYPNPVYNEIAFSGIEDVKSVDIVSMNGTIIACSLNNGKINVSNLAAGEYVLVVNKSISGKFIKK